MQIGPLQYIDRVAPGPCSLISSYTFHYHVVYVVITKSVDGAASYLTGSEASVSAYGIIRTIFTWCEPYGRNNVILQRVWRKAVAVRKARRGRGPRWLRRSWHYVKPSRICLVATIRYSSYHSSEQYTGTRKDHYFNSLQHIYTFIHTGSLKT